MINLTIWLIIMSSQLARAQENQEDPTASNFQPSLFVVIGVLSFMFTLTFILLIYAKFCHRQPLPVHDLNHNDRHPGNNTMFGTNTRFSGLDKAVVDSLPFFRFSSLRGSKQGLQCSVCLGEFGELEILRLLPKCKHGFHIECIDQWLEIHSTCPLCRQKVSPEDLSTFINSTSMRFLNAGEDSSVATHFESASIFELFIEREESSLHGSSKFSIGGSFRRILSANKEDEMPMQEERALHRLNHQIVVSDVMFKNRWSNVSSSDLMFLNSEMLGAMSSDRFPSPNMVNEKCSSNSNEEEVDDDHYRIMNIKDEMERKIDFEHTVGQIKGSNSTSGPKMILALDDSREMKISSITRDKRAMSEITALSRFKDLMSMKNKLRQCLREPEIKDDYDYDAIREDIKRRRIWFPIAKRTVQWFANREKNRSQQQQELQNIQQTLDV